MAGTILIRRRAGSGAPSSLNFGELAWGDTGTASSSTLFVGTNAGGVLPIGGSVKAASGGNSDITSITGLTTMLAINQGGTGQATAPAAFNALSPVTTLGDLIYGSAANTNSRLAGNTAAAKNFLTQTGTGTVSAAPAWSALFGSDVPVFTASGGSVPSGAASRAGAVPDPGATAGTIRYLREDGTWVTPPNPGGTVTAVSVATANGLAGTSSGGATPALTLTTTVTGLLKGNGTAISAAAAGTDYLSPTGSGAGLTNLNGTAITTGTVSLTVGGTGANLSATGGAGQYVKQATSGGAFTVGAIPAGDLPALNNITAPTGSVSLSGQKIVNLLDPTNPQDAATKNYVDAGSAGLDPKGSVRNATTPATSLGAVTYANGTNGVGATITGPTNTALPAVDGITNAVGDRILIKDSVVVFSGVTGAGSGGASDLNGIYTVTSLGSGSTQWVLTRSADNNQNKASSGTLDELTAGNFTFVEAGTVNLATGWVLNTINPITIGTTPITWVQFSGQGTYTAGSGLSLSGGAFTVQTDGTTVFVTANTVAVKSTATTGQVLRSTGTATQAATWGALDLTNANAVSGALGGANGGTGNSVYAVGDILVASSTSALTRFPIGTAGQFLTVNSGANGLLYTSTLDGGSY